MRRILTFHALPYTPLPTTVYSSDAFYFCHAFFPRTPIIATLSRLHSHCRSVKCLLAFSTPLAEHSVVGSAWQGLVDLWRRLVAGIVFIQLPPTLFHAEHDGSRVVAEPTSWYISSSDSFSASDSMSSPTNQFPHFKSPPHINCVPVSNITQRT